jgi:gluconolactonase
MVDNTLYLTDIPYGRIFSVDLAAATWDLITQYDGEPNGYGNSPHLERTLTSYLHFLD